LFVSHFVHSVDEMHSLHLEGQPKGINLSNNSFTLAICIYFIIIISRLASA